MAEKKPKYVYKAELKRVVDGDTIDLVVDAGFYISVHQRFRLASFLMVIPNPFGYHYQRTQHRLPKM